MEGEGERLRKRGKRMVEEGRGKGGAENSRNGAKAVSKPLTNND